MRVLQLMLLGALALFLSGCIFTSDKPALSRTDAFPGVGNWRCKDINGKESSTEVKVTPNGYQMAGDPAWFKRLDNNLYLLQSYGQVSKDVPGKRYIYGWIELAGNRMLLYFVSMDGLATASSNALRAGVELESISNDIVPIYRVKGEPEQALRFLTFFTPRELMAVMSCVKS
ncbi:hypothetical protein [Meiothermus cerbereus]|uniref:hypothetical protein n=1 Tax=Meiothermus cerbereus TaxID=65552 RepID=UPI000481B553|nr:hypothetical protein [Meiothermus cerbereus]